MLRGYRFNIFFDELYRFNIKLTFIYFFPGLGLFLNQLINEEIGFVLIT